MFCICSYSKFVCRIEYSEKEKHYIEKFRKAFGKYYTFSFHEKNHHAVIQLCEESNRTNGLAELSNCDIIKIHDSHSKNPKMLLDGTMYFQKNAKRYAKILSNDTQKREMIIKDSMTVVSIRETTVKLYGNNLYNDLVYVFESLFNTYMESVGGISIHAASCVFSNEGIVICGKSGSGKTTFLFDMIKQKGAIFHANDRVILYKEQSKVYVCGVPIPVNVPIKTIKTIKCNIDDDLVKNAQENVKVRYNVHELSNLFTDFVCGDVVLNRIYITNHSYENPCCLYINKKDAVDLIELLSPVDECHPNWLGVFKPKYDYAQSKEIMFEYLKDCDICMLKGNSLITAYCKS